MNRRRPGWDPRLSTPGRSRLNTDDWYNRLYQQTADDYANQVRQAESKKKADFTGTAFGDFMAYADSDTPEFAQDFLRVKVPEEVNNIPEIDITPKKDDHSIEDRRSMLKEKKWLNGLKGDNLSQADENELKQLDLWHKIVYNDGYNFLNETDPKNRVKTPSEIALEEARARLDNLGGAPQGYWQRTARRALDTAVGAGTGALIGAQAGSLLGPVGAVAGGVIGAAAGMFFMPSPYQGQENSTKTNLVDDITTSFVRKANEIQVGTSKGKIQRTQEMQLLGENGLEDLLSTMQYRDNLKSQIRALQSKQAEKGLSVEEVGRLNKLQKQWNDSYMDELHASDKLDALASYDPFNSLGPISYMWAKLNRALDVDYAPEKLNFISGAGTGFSTINTKGLANVLNRIDFAYDLGLRDDLAGMQNDLRKLRQARREDDLLKQKEAIESIQKKLSVFNGNAEKRKQGWADDIEFDKKDLERIDNNYQVSEYYNLQDQLAQDLGLFSPKKLLFSSAGLLGSSMSSTPKSLLKVGSWVLGAMASGPGALAGAASINLISGGAQATDENNAEVGLTYQISDFINALRSQGALEATIADGRKQLKNDKAGIDDIIEAFTEGKIMFTDRKVRDAILNIIAGANQQWAYDMNATAPGVWTDAAITVVPDAFYLKAARYAKAISPKQLRQVFKNTKGIGHEMAIGADMIPEEELIMLERAAANRGIKDFMAIPFKRAQSAVANKFQSQQVDAAVDFIREKTSAVASIGKHIPMEFLKGPKGYPIKRAAKSMATRSMIGSSEEFWEEDVQSIREHERKAGKYGSEFVSGIYNPNLIFNNVIDGVRSSWDFLFKDPSLATQEEKEIWREAKLGALGWFLQGGAPVFVQSARGTWKQYNATDLITQQVLNTKAEDDAQIKRGIKFSQHARSYDDYVRAMQAFDDIERYNQSKNKQAEQNNDADNAAFADEAIAQNRALYTKIYNLQHSPYIKAVLDKAGIKEGTEKFSTAISMLARQYELASDAEENVGEIESHIRNMKAALKGEWFFNNYLNDKHIQFTGARTPDQVEIPEGKLGGQKKAVLEKKQQEINERTNKQNEEAEENWRDVQRKQYHKYIDDMFYLASVGSLIDQINTYSQLETLTNKKSDFLRNLKKELKMYNDERKEAGYKTLDTEDDVLQYVQDRDLYEYVKDLYRQFDGRKQDKAATQSILDRMLTPEKVTTGNKTEDVYQINKMIETYQKNTESDLQLQQALEDDFFNLVQHKNEVSDYIENTNIGNTNNIYTGYDGKTYIVIPKVDDKGNTYYAKYEYDEDEHDAIGSELPFDDEEYYVYNKMVERDREREQSADISDEDRVSLGNTRKRRENRQLDYAETHRLSDSEYDSWQYSEGESQTPEDAQSTSERIIKERRAEDDRRAAEAEERHSKLLEENPDWQYSEGEDTEDELSLQMQRLNEAKIEAERQAALAEERERNLAERASRQEPDDKVHRLYDDGYRFYEGRTKRGKPRYYAKKDGEKEVHLTEREYNEGFDLQVRRNREQNLRSTEFFDYDPKLSVHKEGLFADQDAYAQVEAIILGSIYDGNEQRFNDLMDYFGTVLTDNQINTFRYVWLQINDTVAEERESLNAMKGARDARASRIRDIMRQQYIVHDLIRSIEYMLFKMHDVYASINAVQVADWVSQFADQKSPKTKGIIKKQLLGHKDGVNLATQIVAIAKSYWNVYNKGNKYFAQAPTGEEYELTKFQYEFYDFIKHNLDRKLLEFKPESQDRPTPSFDAFINFINTIAEISNLSQEEVMPDSSVVDQPQVVNGIYFDPMTMNLYLGIKDERDGRDGVGDFSERVTETAQDAVIKEIKKYSIASNPNILGHLTTGYHYFTLDDNGNVVMFDRAHTAISKYDSADSDNALSVTIDNPRFSKYSQIKETLSKVKSIDEFEQQVLRIQAEFNENVAKYYEVGSVEYKDNVINLEGYIKYTRSQDKIHDSVIQAIANIASYDSMFSTRKKFYHRAGTIIDEIARLIFQDKLIYNKPEYKMSDEVFKSLCNTIYRKKHTLDKLGIKVITDEILLTGTISNVRYENVVAGVPDMIAVDKQGNTYLIDFKTTSGLLPYIKSSDSPISINNSTRMSPREARRYAKDNLDRTAEFDRTQLIQYAKQIAIYGELMKQTFGESPKRMYIAPIYLKRLPKEKDPGALDVIESAEPFAYFEIEPDAAIVTPKRYDWSEIDAKFDKIVESHDLLKQDIVKGKIFIGGEQLTKYNDVVARINRLGSSIHDLKNQNLVPEDSVQSELAEIVTDLQNLREEVKNNKPVEQPVVSTPQPSNPSRHNFNPTSREATGELRTMYNNVDYNQLFTIQGDGTVLWKRNVQWSDEKRKAFIRVTALPDFIENSRWELNVPAYMRSNTSIRTGQRANRPTVPITIYYDENHDGTVTHHQFGGLLMQVRTNLDDGTVITNQRKQNPLLLKIDSLLYDFNADDTGKQKPGAEKLRIVLTGKSRANGVVRHNPIANMKNAMEAFKIDDADLETLYTGDGNDVGIVGITARGSLGRIKPPSQKDRSTIRGIREDRSMKDGQVAISMKMPYTEDKEARQNSPIIPFTAKFFGKSDAIFIVDLLANFGQYQNQGYKIKINGEEYDSPISAHDLVYNTILRFRAGAETGNNFVIDFHKDGDKYDFSKVDATAWGTSDRLTFDLTTRDGKNQLYNYLLGASVWYQNERLMTMGTTRKLDTTPTNFFLNVEQFFKDHPEVNQISYSESLIFDRSDFDPDGDGSFKGIHGFTWMMRHGWMQSTYRDIIAPLISATDAEVIEDEINPEIDDAPFVSQEKQAEISEQPKSSIEEQLASDAAVESNFVINLSDAAEISDEMYNDLLGLVNEKGPDKVQSGPAVTPINREVAEKRLKRILGKNFPVRFIPTFVEMFANGDNSVGRLTKRGIILSEYAENGVEFHEAFHAIVEVLLPEPMRKKLYKHYVDHYNNGWPMSDRLVAEGLADLYYDFKNNVPEVKFTWNLAKLFKNIINYARALRNLNDIKMAMMFAATDAGMMKAFSVKPGRLADIESRFGRGLDYTIRDSQGFEHKLKEFANSKQVNDFVDVLMYKLINNAGIDLLGKNLWQLDTRLGAIRTTLLATPQEKSKMQDEYQKAGSWDNVAHSSEYKKLVLEGVSDEKLHTAIEKGIISPLTARNAKLFREAFDNWDLFRPILEKKIAALGVDKKVARENSAVEDMDGGEGHNQEEFGHYSQPFYEHSIREDVPTKIRYFLSTIPNRKFADYDDVASGRIASMYYVNKDGKKERMYLDVRNNSMGYSTFMPYSKVYNTLLRMAHGARNLQEMDDLLNQLGKTDYIMYRVGKAFHRFRTLMYQRWTKDDFDGEYMHKPKVLVRGTSSMKTLSKDGMTMLHPSEYTADEFPTVVRYANDVVSQTGEILHKQGDIIQDAVILTDPDYEQLVVQLFQAVHAQRLNFQHIYSVQEVNQNGRPTGRFSYEQQSTSQDYDTQLYPRLWFNSIRSGFGGIFTTDEKGDLSVIKSPDGKALQTFGDAAKALRNIRTAVSSESGKLSMHSVPIRGTNKDLFNEDDFAEVEIEFVRLLNQVGVQMDVSTLNYMLLVKYPRTNLVDAFRNIFTSTGIDSIEPFISKDGVLERLQDALNSDNYGVFFNDLNRIKNEKNPDLSRDSSGFVIYGENGFLIDLAKWVGQYRLANRDAMQIGPNNTKLYTYAQHHSASEATIELNHVFDDNGNEIDHGLMHDLKQSPYIISENGEGSIIAKNVLDPNFNPTHDRVKLATFEGIKLSSSNTGGTKYAEITSREDWLSKAAILQNGNIIFPTLSDKSTWFYLLGFILPGINYNNIDIAQLPKFSNTPFSRMFFNREQFNSKSYQQYYGNNNDIIDQLIEYAYRELDLVNQTMNQLGIQDVNRTDHYLEDNEKIANFHKGTINGARFAFLTGVYGHYNEEDGSLDENVDEFYDFNRYDEKDPEKSVIESRERAMRVFFDKKENETDEQLKARQRSMIANILQHRVKKQLEDLVDKGIIERLDDTVSKQYKDKNGTVRYSKYMSEFLGYKNVFLDHKAIDALVEAYKRVSIGNGTYESIYSKEQLESAAIAAYVYDITAKAIMSKEETQRIFTGFPHFFKWQFDDEGHLVNIIEDESKRHGGEGSTGTSNVMDLPNITGTYRCAEIKDYEIASPILSSIERIFRDNEYRDALVDILAEEQIGSKDTELKNVDDVLDAIYDKAYSMPFLEVVDKVAKYKDGLYKNIVDRKIKGVIESFGVNNKGEGQVNVTDGTAYITDKMAENLLRMRGAWNSDVQEAFQYLRGEKAPKKGRSYMSNAKAYKTVMDALIGTQKYSAFGHRMQHGVPVHFYNKYALFPIFKDISYGFSAELYKKMNDPVNGVDMLMTESAVKVGRQGGQKLNPEMSLEDLQNFSFEGRVYEQSYSMVRRQLNTDPHERDLMAMGTQAAKVALSIIQDNQVYDLGNGEFVRGRDLKQQIMNAIKELSGIGVDRVNSRFFDNIVKDENGKIVSKDLNVQKFADFIENELLNRNADKNILDAVQELRSTGAPVLNSVTNMQWIESILISFINKNVIDINLPGNAFYQRSVFGMEGIVGDDRFPVLANGKSLQMINEEGSMDAVVSIDFFYNIIPANIKYNFDKAKQWLIDNGIISGVRSLDGEWHNATANIMAYRIPTQANSSIHALRVVDVLPILRDTIVLPKEFTRITGSDFDIDKLYCSMMQYNVNKIKYKNVVDGGKSSIEYDASTYFDKETNPEQYYQNKLMRMYLSLLKDTGKKVVNDESDDRLVLGRYAHMLHRPIDNDTVLIKNVLKNIESDIEHSPVEPFEAGSLYTQSNLKNDFATGKFGIGPFALNNNNHILTRLYNVSFKSSKDSILTLLGADSLHREKDRDGESILSWMSALINAHVDVAKDSYILRLNVNKYTYNLVSLLVRTGFGKDSLYFTAQPILKRLAIEYQNANGDIVDDPSMSPTQRWKKAEKEFALSIDYGNDRITKKINKLYGYGNAKYNSSDFESDSGIFKALFGIGKDGYQAGSVTLLEDLLTNKNYRIDPNKPASIENFKTDELIKIDGVAYSPKELQGFVFIAKCLFDEYADALGNLVQSTKIDTKKHGISFMEQRQYMNRYNELKDYENNLFDYNLKNMLEDSFIDYKTNAAIPLLKEILGPQMIHFTDSFQSINDKLQDITNNRSNDTRRAIQSSMLAYTKQKVMNRIMEQQGVDFNDLIRGRNSLANRIQNLKNKILTESNPEYSFYASNGVITNSILANLYAVPYVPEYGQSVYHFLQLDNSADDDADIENDYIDSFEQMWNSEDEEIKGIARDLAIYAFMTSADNRGLNKFFKYVPFSLRKDIGYVDGMNAMYRLYASGQMQLSPEGFDINTINVNEFYKNNWRNNKIIPLYKPKIQLVGHKMVYDDVNKQNGQIIKRDSWQIFADYSIRSVNKATGTYAPYVKMRRPYASNRDVDPYLLYRLVGVGKEGRDEFPIYALTDSKGVSVRTGTDIYELYEYERDDQNQHVTTGHRLDDVNWSVIVNSLTNRVTEYVNNPKYSRFTETQISTGTVEKQYSFDPKTNKQMVETIIGTDSEGNQIFSTNQPYGYRQILRQMYNKEKDLREQESLIVNEDVTLRWNDVFKKFCKSA